MEVALILELPRNQCYIAVIKKRSRYQAQMLFFVFVNMDITLGKGNADSSFIKPLFYLFGQFKPKTPIIGNVYPWPDNKIDTAVCQFCDGNGVRRIF